MISKKRDWQASDFAPVISPEKKSAPAKPDRRISAEKIRGLMGGMAQRRKRK